VVRRKTAFHSPNRQNVDRQQPEKLPSHQAGASRTPGIAVIGRDIFGVHAAYHDLIRCRTPVEEE
jgi:hypothetical protein